MNSINKKLKCLLLFVAMTLPSLKLSAEVNLNELGAQIFEQHGYELDYMCTIPAILHCGKLTVQSRFTLSDFQCLYELNQAQDRQYLRGFDGTPCDQQITAIHHAMTSSSLDTNDTTCAGGVLSSDLSQINCPDGTVYQRVQGSVTQNNRGGFLDMTTDPSTLIPPAAFQASFGSN